MPENTEQVPQIIPDGSADADVAMRIELIHGLVRDNPQAFLDELVSLGSKATTVSFELGEASQVVSLKPMPKELILEYFRNRYDSNSQFDPASQAEIDEDSDHQQLVQAFRQSREGGVLNKDEAGDAVRFSANRARDAVRRSSFAIYLRRVVSYNVSRKDALKRTGT